MSVLPSRNNRSVQELERSGVDVRALRSHGLTSVEIENAVRLVDDAYLASQTIDLGAVRSQGNRIIASRFRAAERFARAVGQATWLRL